MGRVGHDQPIDFGRRARDQLPLADKGYWFAHEIERGVDREQRAFVFLLPENGRLRVEQGYARSGVVDGGDFRDQAIEIEHGAARAEDVGGAKVNVPAQARVGGHLPNPDGGRALVMQAALPQDRAGVVHRNVRRARAVCAQMILTVENKLAAKGMEQVVVKLLPKKVIDIASAVPAIGGIGIAAGQVRGLTDRKSTRLNSSHLGISYAV